VTLRVASTAAGIAELAGFCRQHRVGLVAMEATGGYERQPFALMWAAGVPCAVVNPRSVRRFAEAVGRLEKTDPIDAGMIAWYAEVKRITPREPASPRQLKLRALVGRLRQLTTAKVAQTNQRRLVDEPEVLALIDDLVRVIRLQIRSLEKSIAALIDADPLWRALDLEFRTIDGVADRTVARLMADFEEIGTIPNKASSKLAGLAPIARDSGKHSGKRSVRGGRQSVRDILFVVADVVRRHNPDFADVHRRLSEAGKPKKVVRIALARKLLVRLNAKARDVRKQIAQTA
jgi:transposase